MCRFVVVVIFTLISMALFHVPVIVDAILEISVINSISIFRLSVLAVYSLIEVRLRWFINLAVGLLVLVYRLGRGSVMGWHTSGDISWSFQTFLALMRRS